MIKLNHADKYYNRGRSNELHVMNDITLELPETGMIAVFGKSGCGKTTLLNAIGGLDRLNGGEITVFGENISKNTDDIRNKYIGYIFQNYNLLKNETVFENVADALRLCGIDDSDEIYERVVAALTNVGMEKFKNRLPDTLSGGQQQRVAIARALVKNPAIILADEPTGNLDEANTIMIMDILKQISREHLVLLVTHEANLVDFYCDRVIEIVDGRVNSVRDNESANGYSGRNKNDIYLGELEKRESTFDGVKIEYYGEPQEELKLRIVSIDGKLYLKSDSPKLKILDESSEIKLKEGKFEEPDRKSPENSETLDMSHLKPIEGKKFGKLFSFGSAIVSGYRENFSKNNKKGRKLLRASMVLLAFVVVFMSSNFAVSIKALSTLRSDHNDNIFYLPLTNDTDTKPISEHIGENGIDYARVIGAVYMDSTESISFRVGNFMTASVPNIYADGRVLDARLAEKLTLVCGTREFEKPLDVMITTALADDLIENSGVDLISEYKDLLNMVSVRAYNGDNYMRITGVVQSDEKNFYLQSIYATYVILEDIYYGQLSVKPDSFDKKHTSTLSPGQIAVVGGDSSYQLGKTITVMGKQYKIAEIAGNEVNTDNIREEYEKYVKNKYNINLLGKTDYYEQQKLSDPSADEVKTGFEWFFQYYTQYYAEFCMQSAGTDFLSWCYMNYGDIGYLVKASAYFQNEVDTLDLYMAYKYMESYGDYPTQEQFETFASSNRSASDRELSQLTENAESKEYEIYYKDYLMSTGYDSGTYYVMNDSDYTALAYTTGRNDTDITNVEFYSDEYFGNFYCSNYLLIHSDNIEQTLNYLTGYYGESLITPDDVFNEEISDSRSSIITDLISLIVVMALICLCIFFIMRSSLMSRVKEIGVYRAIGVSKKNLTFRFMTESLVLTTLSLLIGFIIASAFVMKLSSYSIFAQAFYFPVWLAAALLIILYAVTLIFGTLPVRLLLRRTPSEILAKYDI